MGIKINNIIILSLISISIYFQDSIFSFPKYRLYLVFKILMAIIPLFFLIILYPNYFFKNIIETKKKIKKIIMTLIYFFINFYLLNKGYNQNLIGIFFPIFMFIFILSLSVETKKRLYIKLYQVISLCLFLSLLSYIMFQLKINLSFEKIETNHPLKLNGGIVYWKHYFYTVVSDYKGLRIERFYGFFDEPGTLGTIIGMIFLFDNNYKILKKERIILFISGMLTLSLAFYIFLFFKFISFPIKKLKKIYIGLTICIFFNWGNYYLKNNYQYIHFKTYGRILGKEDNRASLQAKKILKEFYKTEDIYFGTGKSLSKEYPKINISSWHNIVYHKGIFGLLILIIYIFYLSNFYRRNIYIKILILFYMTSIYQRPNILTYLNLIILISGVEYSNLYIKNKNNNILSNKMEDYNDQKNII